MRIILIRNRSSPPPRRHPKETTMYVCVCNAVTDGEIRSAVMLGVRSFADLSSLLGVATCCGRCTDCARSVLAESLAVECAHAGSGDD
jgi:bacterioferritin-associated ferredoxin